MAKTVESTTRTGPRPRTFRQSGWTELRADLRAAVPDAGIAMAITGIIFVVLYVRVANGTSPTTQIMPFMADASLYWMYWLCQAFGWSALLWAYITIIFGLLRSGYLPPWVRLTSAATEKLHRTTSLTTIALMFMHAFWLFAEFVRSNHGEASSWAGRVALAFAESFVPGWYASGTGRIAIMLGLLAFYLAIPLGLAFYLRRTTGSRMWRALHRFIIVVYVLSVWHTLLYGTNVWYDGWFRTLVWILQIPIAALLLIRLLAPARRSERLPLNNLPLNGLPLNGVLRNLWRGRPPARPRTPQASALTYSARLAGRVAVVAAAVAIAVVVITGVDGGRSPSGASPEPWPDRWVLWTGLFVLLVGLLAVAYRTRKKDPNRT